ncbi:pirin family protein [Rheinheimera nanhaiensis]|uniref:Pirin-like protein PA2418 n=1 Tax=Rheinheimera nanhaiensis E407-8 TaxID=562729 RepID=I1DSV1_9GAMM|nr:pirin family protein [Rheinheimera nanhaiensis]GAB57129.1 pirin-like protein PA2418 [Rheinheimera nanhaiensis E407-8]
MKNVMSVQTASHPHWVGDGFPVKTLLSYQMQGSAISPFLLLDHAGPMQFSATSHRRGVGSHPHRGFETVTLVYAGEVAHRDSTGEQGVIGVGDVQWMTAGSGILHEEYHSDQFAQTGGKLEMFQLWVNLPQRDKMTPPRYQTILAHQIPHIALADNRGFLRVIAGETAGLTGPAKTYSPMLVLDGAVKASGSYMLSLADGWSAMIIVRSGKLKVNFQTVTEHQTLILSQAGADIRLEAEQDSELLVLAGEPLNEPVVGYGPFVMTSDAEIKQALLDFQNGKFGQLT